jgi:simple sugar transport system ATP-binding protein
MNEIPAIELVDITKRFGALVANNRINLDIRRGEIHTLFGENGAGKSTLSNLIYGVLTPDSGEIRINGQPVAFRNPRDAIAMKIGMVHQHFMLVPTLSVVKNVILGLDEGRGPFIAEKAVKKRLQELCEQYCVEIDMDTEVWKLSVGEQQWVEILKALYSGSEILLLDEPTTVLPPHEVDNFLARITEMKQAGLTVVLVSHKLSEIMSVSDRISVLRRGNLVGTVSPKDITPGELVVMMVGKAISFQEDKVPVQPGELVLQLDGVKVRSDRGYLGLKGLDLSVRAGEIVGIAGVAGNGQKELYETIIGLRRPVEGTVRLKGQDVYAHDFDWDGAALISEIPEDRVHEGSIPDFTIKENMLFGRQRWKGFLNGRTLDWNAVGGFTADRIADFDIRTDSAANPARSLSGGNLQRVILARELSKEKILILAAQPTRGLDVVSCKFIMRKLLDERARGISSVIISENLDELMIISDRIAVIYNGRIVADLDPQYTSLIEIGEFMVSGQTKAECK